MILFSFCVHNCVQTMMNLKINSEFDKIILDIFKLPFVNVTDKALNNEVYHRFVDVLQNHYPIMVMFLSLTLLLSVVVIFKGIEQPFACIDHLTAQVVNGYTVMYSEVVSTHTHSTLYMYIQHSKPWQMIFK